MRRTRWLLICFIISLIQSHLGGGAAAEVMMPPPPEGNTTFVEGSTWCVAVAGVSQADLQNALDWACGLGSADCRPIQHGGPCYQPDNLLWHASYAFNSYYQQNGNSDVACNFGGTATITKHDPSFGRCSYSVSEPEKSAVQGLLIACTWSRVMASISLLLLLDFVLL